jgi:hypothetical protein
MHLFATAYFVRVCVMPKTEFDGLPVIETLRRLTPAFLLSFAVISFPGSILAAQAAAPLALCKVDAEKICPGIAPGSGKIIGCLKQHKHEVSVGCAKALKALKAKRGAQL